MSPARTDGNPLLKGAMHHFDMYLKAEIDEAPDGKAIAFLLFGTETPDNPSYETSQKHRIDLRLMIGFAEYLEERARHPRNNNKKLLFLSADRYLATLQHDLLSPLNREISPLNRDDIKIARNCMRFCFDKRARDEQPRDESLRGGWRMEAMHSLFDYLLCSQLQGGPPALAPLNGDNQDDEGAGTFPAG
jgi:hypothetical protein